MKKIAALALSAALLLSLAACAPAAGKPEDSKEPDTVTTPSATTGKYTNLSQQELLDAIAARFGTTVDRLVAINQIPDEDLIVIGQVLTLGLCPAEN